MLITIVIAPTLNIQPDVEFGSGMGLFIMLQQLLLGLSMGFAMRLVFSAVEMGGELMGMQMGLGFASFYDPVNATNTQVIAQFLGIIAILALLNMNGHLYMLETLAEGFHVFPISTQIPAASAMHKLALWGGSIFSQALRLSLPLIGVLLITNLALGVLTRSAPQLNIFAIGFPITLGIGLVALFLTLPYFAPLLEMYTQAGQDVMLRIAKEF